MAYGILSDLKLPQSFSDDVFNRAVETSKVFASGAVRDISAQMEVAPSEGNVKMPFWNDLDGASQPAHSGVNISIEKINQGQDIATVLSRAKGFGAHDLSAAMKGTDPVDVIEGMFAGYWAREFDRITVQNVIAATSTTVSGYSFAANVLNISALSGAAAYVDAESMIDAAGLLGEHEDRLSMLIMHSAVERNLRKQGLIDVERDEDRQPIRTYQGRPVIVSDRLAPSTGNYPILFVGAGAIGYASSPHKVPHEVVRDPLTNGGQEGIVQRKLFALHPRGIAFRGTPAGETAIDSELTTATNWGRVWTAQNIPIVRHVAKLNPAPSA